MDWTFAIGSLHFGIFDILVVVAFLIGGITGSSLGFTRSACKILGFVFCFPLALLFVEPLSSFMVSRLPTIPSFVASLVSYIVLCAVIYILFRILGNLLGNVFETLSLGVLDSLLGFFFGVAFALVVLFLLLEVACIQPFVDLTPLKESSLFYTRIFCSIFPTAAKALKDAISDLA